MDKIFINLKEVMYPVLAYFGITILTGNDDHIQVAIEVNSIGFYAILIALTGFSIWSLNKIRNRIRIAFLKIQSQNIEEIKKNCNEDNR